MTNYIIRRILGFIPVLLGVTLVTFIMIRQIPGGPFDFVGDRQLPPQVVANIEAQYHLDWPIWKQFLSYLGSKTAFSIRFFAQFKRSQY